MSYYIERIPTDQIFSKFENVLLGFKLTRDEDLKDPQIAIKIYNYAPGSTAPTNPQGKPLVTREIRVDYAELLANYDSKKEDFNPNLIDEIFYALNAELALHKYQLKTEIKERISNVLKAYIPHKERPFKGVS